jgi:hypothetical protein
MFCERCRRPFSYAVPRSDNKDQRLCVGCCAHLRAGGAWDSATRAREDLVTRYKAIGRSLAAEHLPETNAAALLALATQVGAEIEALDAG